MGPVLGMGLFLIIGMAIILYVASKLAEKTDEYYNNKFDKRRHA